MTADRALEIWDAPRRAELQERAMGVTIKVEAGEVAEDAGARLPAVPATTDETAAAVGASES